MFQLSLSTTSSSVKLPGTSAPPALSEAFALALADLLGPVAAKPKDAGAGSGTGRQDAAEDGKSVPKESSSDESADPAAPAFGWIALAPAAIVTPITSPVSRVTPTTAPAGGLMPPSSVAFSPISTHPGTASAEPPRSGSAPILIPMPIRVTVPSPALVATDPFPGIDSPPAEDAAPISISSQPGLAPARTVSAPRRTVPELAPDLLPAGIRPTSGKAANVQRNAAAATPTAGAVPASETRSPLSSAALPIGATAADDVTADPDRAAVGARPEPPRAGGMRKAAPTRPASQAAPIPTIDVPALAPHQSAAVSPIRPIDAPGQRQAIPSVAVSAPRLADTAPPRIGIAPTITEPARTVTAIDRPAIAREAMAQFRILATPVPGDRPARASVVTAPSDSVSVSAVPVSSDSASVAAAPVAISVSNAAIPSPAIQAPTSPTPVPAPANGAYPAPAAFEAPPPSDGSQRIARADPRAGDLTPSSREPARQQGIAPMPPAQAAARPAAIVFGVSLPGIFGETPRASTGTRRERTDAILSDIAAVSTATTQITAVMAATGPNHDALDMRREDWPQAMIDRIETLRDAADATDTRIRLAPDALGSVQVSLRHDGGKVHVHFTADAAATRALIADAQPRLADLAQARGIRLGQATVDGGGAGTGQNRHAPPTPQPHVPLRPASARALADAADSTRLA